MSKWIPLPEMEMLAIDEAIDGLIDKDGSDLRLEFDAHTIYIDFASVLY